ncbi:MAG: LLM class flavin-dependent oxidoreductase [Pseudomonadota bacterium]
MRFSLFAHMERLTDDESMPPHAQLYDEFIALCEIADAGGFHAIWTGEHHGMDFTIAPNPFISLTDLARRTRNVRLGTGTVIAPFWHPIKLAGEAAMTDVVSDGRLELGIARGAYSYEYERLMPGMDAWEAGGRMREIVPTLRKLWAGDYAHDGQFYSFPKSSISPRPRQPDGPPLWIAARDPNSHEFAICEGCNVQVTPLWQGEEEINQLVDTFNASCAKFSEIPRPQIMLLQHTYVATDEADAKDAAKRLSRYYAHFGAWFRNERPVSNGFIKRLSDDEIEAIDMYSPDKMQRNLVIGTKDEVIERIRRYESLGFDEFALWLDNGMTAARKQATLNRFIEDVMPAFA